MLPSLLPLLTLLTLLPLLALQPLPACEKLLLKQAQIVLKASRPPEPRAPPPQDDPEDYSKAIALMRKTYFADVDEYERSGLLKIPPLEDPCGAGILPASPPAPNPPCASQLGTPALAGSAPLPAADPNPAAMPQS